MTAAVITPALPDKFSDLTPAEQRRVLTAGYEMTQLSHRHAAAVCIAPPPSIGGKVNSGTGFVVALDGKHYFGTAWHVAAKWFERKAKGEHVLFQVRDALLNPEGRIAWKNEDDDIVFIELTRAELNEIGISSCEPLAGWPPRQPKVGSYVLVSGFPSVIRRQPTETRIEFNSLNSLLQVTTVGERHIVCQFQREHWVHFGGHGSPPPGTDLGGISGGPVLSVGNLSYPLIGAALEFQRNFELLYIRTLAHLPSSF